jgi:hypothetical protein
MILFKINRYNSHPIHTTIMPQNHHACYAWSCSACDYQVVGKTKKEVNMRERLHLKVCKDTGRTEPKITHEEVEQKCYGGLSRKQNALYKNMKYDDGVDTRTKVPAHIEQARMLEEIINSIYKNCSPDVKVHIPNAPHGHREGLVGCENVFKKKKNKKRRGGTRWIVNEGMEESPQRK